jgi:transcriptional regulator with XRE-family HTH domain
MTNSKKGPSTAAIDGYVGQRIRERRTMLGLTLRHFAELIGVTFQQVLKYERGINRVSAGRLYGIARVLNAPIAYFYDGMGEEAPHAAQPRQRMLLETTRDFAAIENKKHQEAISAMARALAEC